jgi:hypothetical protein
VGADAIGQKRVDFGSHFAGAVVYDVVGHWGFLLTSVRFVPLALDQPPAQPLEVARREFVEG